MTADDFKNKTPEQFVDSALQTYARTGMYPGSRAMHECAHAYRRELLRIVTDWRERGGQHIDQPPTENAECVKHCP
jgi:hypothetical protein